MGRIVNTINARKNSYVEDSDGLPNLVLIDCDEHKRSIAKCTLDYEIYRMSFHFPPGLNNKNSDIIPFVIFSLIEQKFKIKVFDTLSRINPKEVFCRHLIKQNTIVERATARDENGNVKLRKNGKIMKTREYRSVSSLNIQISYPNNEMKGNKREILDKLGKTLAINVESPEFDWAEGSAQISSISGYTDIEIAIGGFQALELLEMGVEFLKGLKYQGNDQGNGNLMDLYNRFGEHASRNNHGNDNTFKNTDDIIKTITPIIPTKSLNNNRDTHTNGPTESPNHNHDTLREKKEDYCSSDDDTNTSCLNQKEIVTKIKSVYKGICKGIFKKSYWTESGKNIGDVDLVTIVKHAKDGSIYNQNSFFSGNRTRQAILQAMQVDVRKYKDTTDAVQALQNKYLCN